LPIGRIAGLFGIRGELKCDPTTAGRSVFSPGVELRCDVNGRSEIVSIEDLREHKGRLLLTLHGVADATAAERFVGGTFYVDRDLIPLEAGEYLDVDLIGCTLRSVDGTIHGRVERVEHYPASDMLVVAGRMVPMVHAFIRSIDIAKREITVDVPPGLLDDNTE